MVMNSTHKKYIIRNKCQFCGMILDGTELTLEKGEVVGQEEMRNKCSCSLEKTLAKMKGICCICGDDFYTPSWTEEKKLKHYFYFGNWCGRCFRQYPMVLRKKKYENRN